MYEPLKKPNLDSTVVSTNGVRFGITHQKSLRRHDDPNADSLHIHEYLEIVFNISGDVSFMVGDRLLPIRHGDAVVSRKGEVHMCIYNKKSVHEHFCLWIDADENSELFEFLDSGGVPHSPLFTFDEATNEKLFDLLLRLDASCKSEGSSLERSAYLLSILSLMRKSEGSSAGETQLPEELKIILDQINESFTQIQRLADIEGAKFISPATLNRWFRKYIHLSPKEYIESKKLSYAANLLTSGKSVTESCMLSGFSDCSHFIILFKKKFGETPLRYKKHYGG